ncbi:RluA family pseudouridine synthase [Nitzschia inconspicua]|uniref:RluA family pseudouridine synthase n=1 Tax=Nitzschia inconspicua TaxID=303405 RepID=A0A9K3KQK7_9STRA|nr:RluA family pseudouridine synthase [Nitzschia inconspicua]
MNHPPPVTQQSRDDGDVEDVASVQQQQQQRQYHQQSDRKKRGMKPRSQRNRKRPRSQVHSISDNDDNNNNNNNSLLKYTTTHVRRLELDGEPLASLKHQSAQWLRVVEPYPYTFSTFAKARWENRTILDVYCTEFGSYPPSYYECAIAQGRILVSDTKVDVSYRIKGGDVLSHTVHRHEPGVAVQSSEAPHVTVIAETDEVLVVDKPATLPVHPCGGYHVQSLMSILEKHHCHGNKLYTIHRIDRLTSGLVILGKTSAVAQAWGKSIMNRDCQKIYLARVRGKFPMNCPNSLIRLSESAKTIPWHGEWNDESLSKQDTSTNQAAGTTKHATHVDDLRKQYAYTYWLTDEQSTTTIVGPQTASVNDVFQCQRSVDEWLDSLKKHSPENTQADAVPVVASKHMLWFHLACPTRIAQHKDGICEAGCFDDLDTGVYKKSVKPAASSFGVISYDDTSDSTLLVCRPYTGRTHQLRLHLQHLGHPIANDPNYGGDMWFGNEEGREAAKLAQDRLDRIVDDDDVSNINNSNSAGIQPPPPPQIATTTATDVPATEKEIETEISQATQGTEESIHDFIRRTCVWCARSNSVGGSDRTILEFMIRSPGIWLHALQYSFSPELGDSNSSTAGGTTTTTDEPAGCISYRTGLPAWHTI